MAVGHGGRMRSINLKPDELFSGHWKFERHPFDVLVPKVLLLNGRQMLKLGDRMEKFAKWISRLTCG